MRLAPWKVDPRRFRVSTPQAWLRMMRTLNSSLGTEAESLIAAAAAGDPDIRQLEREWARRLIGRLDIHVVRKGLEHIRQDERYVVVALHEGFADALMLLDLGLDLRFAARSELWEWPVLGDYLTSSDHAVVDPERPIAGMRALLRLAQAADAADEHVTVFAQGTILGIETALRRGAFEVAARRGLRVLPVVIAGTHRIWEHPFSPTLRFGCPVYVEVLQPVSVAEPLAACLATQRLMKKRALGQPIEPRHFDPDRDGIWLGYSYAIDPAFPDVARRVALLRGDSQVEATA